MIPSNIGMDLETTVVLNNASACVGGRADSLGAQTLMKAGFPLLLLVNYCSYCEMQ
jgi:hypothetical protein